MSKRTDDTSQKPPVERSFEQYESATVSSDLQTRPLAVVTGASTGIGYELAKCCAKGGFELLIAADEPAIHQAAATARVASKSRPSKPILRPSRAWRRFTPV